MRKLALAAALAAAGVSVAGCATQPYGYSPYGYNNGYYPNGYYNNGYNNGYYGGYGNSQAGNVVGGAAIGAATGAVAGAVLPGIKPGTGAIAGAILGGVSRRERERPAILSRYPRLLLLRRPVRTAALQLRHPLLVAIPFFELLDGAEGNFRPVAAFRPVPFSPRLTAVPGTKLLLRH